MSLISDKSHVKKLKENNINIKTKYIVGNRILERNTDNSHNDDIDNGIRCEKQYFINNELKHTEKLFDSRIEYTFISEKQENTDYICPNCGNHGKLKEFLDGCKYCGTYYNVDYVNKDLGGKYHYDRVLKSNKYRIITLFVDLVISIIISFIFIKLTSRTFNSIDVVKIFAYGVILSLVLYYFFYILDAYIILGPIKRYKDRQNQKQIDFWNRTGIDKKTFFNNLNYELRNKFYSSTDIIDYDLIDFIEFNEYKKDNSLYVEVKCDVRIVSFNNKISSKFIEEIYTFKHISDDVLELKEGANIIKCHNCGASIDATKGRCNYCDTEIKHLQSWILVD